MPILRKKSSNTKWVILLRALQMDMLKPRQSRFRRFHQVISLVDTKVVDDIKVNCHPSDDGTPSIHSRDWLIDQRRYKSGLFLHEMSYTEERNSAFCTLGQHDSLLQELLILNKFTK